MSAQKVKCEGCRQDIIDKKFLTCVLCSHKYDLKCANVLEKHFYSLMTPERKRDWKCPHCTSKIPKKGNTGTPIRQQETESNQQGAQHDTLTLLTNENVTLRRNTQRNCYEDLTSSEKNTVLGDTLYAETSFDQPETQLTMENLSDMISKKLEKNNESLLAQFKNLIQIEVTKTIDELKEKIKNELKLEIEELCKLNKCRMNEIQEMKNEVGKLMTINQKLQKEIQEIEIKCKTSNSNPHQYSTPENISKKIVLYGFPEYYRETDLELHDRLCDMFQQYFQVNLVGYIEETRRIGKFNNNQTRPLVIELISKKMTKFLLDNKRYLYGAKLSISEYLDNAARIERKTMREKMQNARKQGLYAVIHDNTLIIKDRKSLYRDEKSLSKKSSPHPEKKRPFRA